MTIFDLFRLDGCVALVTGGSRGIGLELADALHQAGARVALAARRPRFFGQAREQIPDALCLECDVIDEDSVREAVAATRRELGPIDVLVNSAGVSWGAPAVDMPADRFRQVMQVNVDGSFLASKAVAPAMLERGYGKIINIASVTGLRGEEPEILDAVGYSASKGAVISMTRDLAVKWGPSGIRVNALAPGYFPSRMTEKLLEQTESLLSARIPLRRIGRAGELAGAGLFLASPASDYVNGHILVVDGGQTC